MEIKPQELRIGNIVTDQYYDTFKHEIVVKSIHKKGINISAITLPTSEGYYDFDELKGIELDHEWYERLGFKYIDMMFENVPMQYYRNELVIIENSEVRLMNQKEVVIKIKVQYVHQLQNLFFSLTGEELAIDKTSLI